VNAWTGHGQSYEQLRERFRLEVPKYFNMTQATVGRHAIGPKAKNLALVCDDPEASASRRYTYAQLYVEALRMATFFRRQGVQPGDVVVCYTQQG